MAFLEHKIQQRLGQKQVLTPGLVQMVNLLQLNKLELTEMVQQELVQNPVLEEATEIEEEIQEEKIEMRQEGPDGERVAAPETDTAETVYQEISEREPSADITADSVPEALESTIDDDPYRDFDYQQFENYLNDGSTRPRETEHFERPSFESFAAKLPTLTDHLEWQLGMNVPDENIRLACHSIIGNLNEDGYLMAIDEGGKSVPLTVEEISATGNHTLEEVVAALEIIQSFDPPGVGARDVRECLMLQLEHLEEADSLAYEIVRDHLHKVQLKQWKEIAKAVNVPVEEVAQALEVIKTLDPRPGQKYNRAEAPLIEPDVFIVKVGDEYKVVTNEDEVPQLRLSKTYKTMLDKDRLSKEDKAYVRDCFKSAFQLLKNIEQRKHIIVKVCEAVIGRQQEYLDKGIDYLKPMMIKDVAEEVGVHPSTVSRAVANKFAHTPQGVKELRFFFSEAVNGPMGNGTSLLLVKRKVQKFIENEDPKSPLTDDRIAQMLKDEGIVVTRRSITKYREDLKIPSTHQRRVRA